jgi:hypothetical protein
MSAVSSKSGSQRTRAPRKKSVPHWPERTRWSLLQLDSEEQRKTRRYLRHLLIDAARRAAVLMSQAFLDPIAVKPEFVQQR